MRLLRHRRFARIVDMPRAVLESGARRRVVANRNELVGRYRFVDGVKTGTPWTPATCWSARPTAPAARTW